jgi:hypothetical protein
MAFDVSPIRDDELGDCPVDRNEKLERPLWVKIGLWGLPRRASALFFFWLSIAITLGCVAYGFVNPRWFLGSGLILAALWYYLCIRWVDRHGEWT